MVESEEARWRDAMKKTVTAFGGSSATGAAKAAPGVAVGAGAAELFSTSVQDLITYGTLIYIGMMIFYSVPKCVDTVRYLIALWRGRRSEGLRIALQRDHELTNKIQGLRIRELEAEICRLKGVKKDASK